MNELERALVSLRRELDLPEPPELVPGVLAALERPAVRAPRRRWALALAVALLALLGATLVIPDARSALLRVIGFGGEEIRIVDELPEVPPAPDELDLGLVLGRRVTLAEARAEAGFPLRELPDEPDRVYLGERGTVWFLYGTPSEVRLLVAQTPRTRVDAPYILKKLAGSGTPVSQVQVAGRPALFLSGEPHVVALVDENGVVRQESARLAENVLLWEDAGVAFRLEGAFPEQAALELAESLR